MKKVYGKVGIVALLALISYLLFENIIFPFIIIFVFIIVTFIKSNEEDKKNKKEVEMKEYEFANMLSYLLVFLENNFNVYQSLEMTLSFIKEILVKDVEELINDIDVDKSIEPYQKFASKFKSNIVYQVVMMIYQLDINGYDAKYLNNFPSLISSLKEARVQNMISTRKMNMSFMTIVPIISLLMVGLVLIFYILMSVGGF